MQVRRSSLKDKSNWNGECFVNTIALKNQRKLPTIGKNSKPLIIFTNRMPNG